MLLECIVSGEEKYPLNNREWYPCDPDIIYLIADQYIFNGLNLPGLEGPPVIFSIENKELEEKLEKINNYKEKRYTPEAIEQLKGWLNTAKENGTDLVMFYS